MIHLFDIQDNVVIPTVHCKLIPQLNAIIEKYPNDNIKIFAYLFYTTYIGEENPYFNVPEDERDSEVIKDLKLDISMNTKTIIEAKEKLKKLYTTPTMGVYISLKKTLERLSNYLDKAVISDGKGGNIGDIMGILKDFSKIRQSFKDVANDLKEEQEVTTRGGQELAYDQE